MTDYDPVLLVGGLRQRYLDAGITPVMIGPLVDAPDRSVGITLYPVSDDSLIGLMVIGLQVLMRDAATAGYTALYARQEQIYRLTVSLVSTEVNTVPITTAWRQISAPLSLDGQGRPEMRDTYYLRSDRLGTRG